MKVDKYSLETLALVSRGNHKVNRGSFECYKKYMFDVFIYDETLTDNKKIGEVEAFFFQNINNKECFDEHDETYTFEKLINNDLKLIDELLKEGDYFENSLFCITLIGLDKEFRGNKLAKRIIDTLLDYANVHKEEYAVVLKSFPLEYNESNFKVVDKEDKKLTNYYRSIGFEEILKNDNLLVYK